MQMAFRVSRELGYRMEETLTMPFARLVFLSSGLRVLFGDELPTKHLTEEQSKLVQTAIESKDELTSVLEQFKRGDLQ